MTKLKEAQNFIKENGIDSDEYVSKNIEYFMSGGDPDDNSISLYNEHQGMLKIIIEAGLKVGQIEPLVIPKIAEEVFDQIHNILCESKFGMNDPKARVKILAVLDNISIQYNELTNWLYDKHPKVYESYFNGE